MKATSALIAAGVLLMASAVLSAQNPTPGKKNVEGVTNFTQLDTTIACAGALKAAAVPELKRMGFVSIVNLRLASEEGANVEAEKAAAEAAGVKYFHLPFSPPSRPDENVDAVVEEFLRVTSARANQPLFVHCGGGGRASAMWLIKRVIVDGWEIEKAKAEAEQVSAAGRAVDWAVNYVKTRRK